MLNNTTWTERDKQPLHWPFIAMHNILADIILNLKIFKSPWWAKLDNTAKQPLQAVIDSKYSIFLCLE